MYCKNCGASLPDGSVFCRECGHPVEPEGSAYGTGGGQSAPQSSPVALTTDRNFLLYVLFCFLTCGLYSYYFLYYLARDMAKVLDGDGRRPVGSLGEIVGYSILTGGIYGSCWYFTLANRMKMNAPRYGVQITEDGTEILLWMTVGILLCGLGPFIGMYKICKNANMLCEAYNRYNHL